MKWPIIMIELIILSLILQKAAKSDETIYKKEQMAILSFGGDVESWIKETLTNKLEVQLANSGRFIVIAKKNIKEALDELALSQTGIIDETQALQVGRLLNAQKIIIGNIEHLSLKLDSETKWFEVELTLSLKILDIKHEILLSHFEITADYFHENKNTAILEAMNKLVNKAINNLTEIYILKARIIDVNRNEIFINLGDIDGVKKGMLFEVYHMGEISGLLKITSVSRKFSRGKIIKGEDKIGFGDTVKEFIRRNPKQKFLYIGTGVYSSEKENSNLFVETGATFYVLQKVRPWVFTTLIPRDAIYTGFLVNFFLDTKIKSSPIYIGIGKLYELDFKNNLTIKEIGVETGSLRFFLSLIDENVRMGLSVHYDFRESFSFL